MRKIILFLIFGLFFHFSSFSIGDYYVNDSLFVHVPGGVNMHGSPSAKRAKVTTIPYGSKVLVVYDSFRKKSMKVEEREDFFIKGHWVRIKYNGQIGYVFDGYLSKLPAFSLLGDHKLTKKFYTREKHYLAFMLGRYGQKEDIISSDCGGDSDCVVGYKQAYNYGVRYSEWYDDDATQHVTLEFPNFTKEEVYFIAMELYYGVLGNEVLYNKKKKVLEIIPTDNQSDCPVSILMDGAFPIIEYDCMLK